jgi:hypothetical protein
MPKLVLSLTDSKIKSAISMQKKSFEKNIKLSDGGGLYLLLEALLHKDFKDGAFPNCSNLSDDLGVRSA